MKQRLAPVPRIVPVLTSLLFLILLPSASTSAQAQAGQPRTVHNACAANCVADVTILHSGMGDTQARYAFDGWFGSYYDLAGCDDPAWKTDILFLIDIIGDAVGAPGAPTMQCWQGLAAQASLCSDSCAEYFVEDARYAPNVKLSLDQRSPGYLEATLDNQSNLAKLPELQPNAYSRQFHLKTYLAYAGGESLLVNDTPMPSLSFPNWITRGGIDICIAESGFDSARCQILSNFATPSIVSISVDFLDGILYDLSGQVGDLSDTDGSFSQIGYIRLLSDGDQITIAQGPYAGYALVKTHYLSSGRHAVQLMPWDANDRPVTITNHECTNWLSTCWLTGVRHETDTYVYALQGPPDRALAGNYTVEVVADIPHDKDIVDNRASYSYDASAITGLETGAGGEAEGVEGQQISVTDLPVTDLDGPGVYPASVDQAALGMLFRLAVPDEVSFMFVRLVSLDGGQYDAFIRRGSSPVPDFPVISDGYHCWAVSDPAYAGGCPFSNPFPDDYYIFVHRWQGNGAFQLEVEWTVQAATPTTTSTAAPSPTPTEASGQEGEGGETEAGGSEGVTTTEVEPNDSHAAANDWDMQQPFDAQLSSWRDRDVTRLTFVAPGIYTFSVIDVGPELRVKMTLVRASSGNYLDSSRANARGAAAHLAMDASAGEQYYLIIAAEAMLPSTNQPYRLIVSDLIPDPDEANDSRAAATPWELALGPVSGYFWDRTTGRHDYFTFLAPATLDAAPVTFALTNPSSELRVRMTLLSNRGAVLVSSPWSAFGQPTTLTRALDSGQRYYLKLQSQNDRTSMQPYVLSAQYNPATEGATEATGTGQPVHLSGFAYQQGVLPVPIAGVTVYAQVAGGPAVLVDVTDRWGTYGGTVMALVAEGAQIGIWAEKEGLTFLPEADTWSPDHHQRSHRTLFVAVGATLVQQTPTADAGATATPLPTRAPAATPTPTLAPTEMPPASATPTVSATLPPTVVTGYVWRLFPDYDPAGVGGAGLFLTINGVEQPAVSSMIDGSYRIEIAGLQAGDQLSLRAAGAEDSFEPLSYQWQAEAGIDTWRYDFYSYWGTITPPASNDQNRIYGYVRDAQGAGVPGLTLLLQVGTSDALQVLGPTDANGYYETLVRLPDRVMVTVWVQTSGYSPSRLQFFHAYAPEDREASFVHAP